MNRNTIIQKFSTIVLVEKPATSLRISLIILSRRFKSINQKKNVEENGKMKNSEDNEKSRGGFARYEKPRCFFWGVGIWTNDSIKPFILVGYGQKCYQGQSTTFKEKKPIKQ